ncbi:hypothetical protein [Catellatospora citrea]|uniref:Uncharacterized protein n=1 Tax=Catellatospora citrea TaxID=53366 RepID=A0A8J3KKK8_9ACTN|nr:hypothetical protein [Catellatospora citrea]RKE05616.1 hypothetical protein C8E86_0420 [Catellatospora citrea]GIF96969.1 hypothetical protein Cci01nite_20630 [Catellatospora citrea]
MTYPAWTGQSPTARIVGHGPFPTGPLIEPPAEPHQPHAHLPWIEDRNTRVVAEGTTNVAVPLVAGALGAQGAIDRADGALRIYLRRVAAFCLGPQHHAVADRLLPDGTTTAAPIAAVLAALPHQLPGWQPLVDAVLSATAAPAQRVWSRERATQHAAHLNRLRGQVSAFLLANYRALPSPPDVGTVQGWFRWSVRAAHDQQWKRYDDYLRSVAAFCEPRLPMQQPATELAQRSFDLAQPIWQAEAIRQEAAARLALHLSPADLSAWANHHLTQLRPELARLHQAVLYLHSLQLI